MTAPGGITDRHLRGMLDSPFGCDVYAGERRVRGLLVREERQESDAQGFGVNVYVTALTIADADLPDVRVDDRLLISASHPAWTSPALRAACTEYTVRRVGRIDDVGARELLVTEVRD